MRGGVFSIRAPPKTLKGYVAALLMRWFAGPMMNLHNLCIKQYAHSGFQKNHFPP